MYSAERFPDSSVRNEIHCIIYSDGQIRMKGIIEEWYRGSDLSSLWSDDHMGWRIFLCLKVWSFWDVSLRPGVIRSYQCVLNSRQDANPFQDTQI